MNNNNQISALRIASFFSPANLRHILTALCCLVLLQLAPKAAAQNIVTVTEFYNASLDHYFRTADSLEASGIDNGAAGSGWVRTGDNFKAFPATAVASGVVPVCRFYGSVTPGPNSHFYTADQSECDSLKAQQQSTASSQKRWNYEGLAFALYTPSAGACASGLTAVYRLYNNGAARGIDSNHRYTTLSSEYQRLQTAGWSGEGVAMCAPAFNSSTAGDWLTFTLNTQDFAYPDRSAATVDRVITLHEAYKIPVDIYLTDNMLATFETSYPALITRLRTSPYVGLNYHIRPPKPYYTGYDWAGLSGKSSAEQLTQIRNYESHVTDLVTGLPSSTAGGFTRLKQLTGNNWVISAFQADTALYASVSQVFAELGSNMTISHSLPYVNLGTQAAGLYVRPEHYDLLLFQSPGQSATTLIDTAFTTARTTSGAVSPYVVGVKMHDNDFFAQSSAWTNTYINARRSPPWDISTRAGLKTDAEIQAEWTLYEGALAYAAANRNRVASVNALGLGAAITGAPAMPLLYVSGTMHIESDVSRWPDPTKLISFFQRAVAAGKVGSQSTGMRWSIGADVGWLNNEARAGEVIRTLSALGVEWDIHVHSASDRATAAQKIIALGGTPNTVLSGVQVSDIDTVRNAQSGSAGYSWKAESLWGMVRTGSHTAGSEDFSSGLWQPRSSTDWQAHDPAASLIAVGGGARSLAGAETLAGKLALGGYTAPIYSATIMVDQLTLTVSDAANATTSTDGIAQIEAFAARIGVLPNVRWASLSSTASAWRAAGAVPSRIASTQ